MQGQSWLMLCMEGATPQICLLYASGAPSLISVARGLAFSCFGHVWEFGETCSLGKVWNTQQGSISVAIQPPGIDDKY